MNRKKSWTGNSKSIYSPLGSSSHSKKSRAKEDYYATDPKTVDDLFGVEEFSNTIWEIACGEGHLSKQMKKHGKSVYSTDLVDRGYGDDFFDFLEVYGGITFDGDIVTNPPYRYAKEFVEKSMQIIDEGNKVAMFLKLTFLESQKRYQMFKKYPPKKVYIYSKRQSVAKNGNPEEFAKSSAVCYAWFVWVKGFQGNPTIDWIY